MRLRLELQHDGVGLLMLLDERLLFAYNLRMVDEQVCILDDSGHILHNLVPQSRYINIPDDHLCAAYHSFDRMRLRTRALPWRELELILYSTSFAFAQDIAQPVEFLTILWLAEKRLQEGIHV